MDKIKKLLGLKPDATNEQLEEAILKVIEMQKAASIALADLDSVIKFRQSVFESLSVKMDEGDESALGKIKTMIDAQSEVDEKVAGFTKVGHALQNALGLNPDSSFEDVLNAIQELKEQPSNGQSNTIVQGITEAEARKKAKEAFGQFDDENTCFVTSDGQCFFREHHARNHSLSIKGDYFKFER